MSLVTSSSFAAAKYQRNSIGTEIDPDYFQLATALRNLISGEGAKLIAVSQDGRLVVVAKPEGGVAAWSVTDGKQQWSSTLPATAKSVRFSADGKSLRVQCVDGTDRLLDPAHGRESKRRTTPEK